MLTNISYGLFIIRIRSSICVLFAYFSSRRIELNFQDSFINFLQHISEAFPRQFLSGNQYFLNIPKTVNSRTSGLFKRLK